MKKSFVFILTFSALAVAPLCAQQAPANQKAVQTQTPEQQYQAMKKQAEQLMRAKKQDEALAMYAKAADIPGLAPARRLEALVKAPEIAFRSNFPGSGFGAYNDDGINKALATYRGLLNDKAFTAEEKVELYRRIADCLLELMKVDEANAELAQAVKLAKESGSKDILARAYLNQGNVFARQLAPEKAIEAYGAALKNGVDNQPLRFDIARRLGKLVEDRAGRDAALKELSGYQEIDYIINQYKAPGTDAEKITALMAPLKDTAVKMQDRAKAARDLLALAKNTANFELLKEVCKYADEIIKSDPKKYTYIYAHTMVSPNQWAIRGFSGNTDMLLFVAQKALTVQPDHEFSHTCLIDGYLKKKDLTKAREAVKAALAQEKLAKKQNFLILNALLNSTNAKKIAKEILEITKDKKPKDQAQALQNAAQTAWKIGNVELAKGIWAEREAMLVPEPKRQLTCRFLENAPESIEEFLTCDYLKDPKNFGVLDRKYGDNLQFLLETDATITGRTITEDKDPAAQPTRFTASCDAQGVKLFFIMPCDEKRAADLKMGYGGFGGYEMYLATGYDTPYSCFLIDAPPANTVYMFDTQYNNKNYRQLSTKAGNLKYSFKVGKDCVYMLLEIGWAAVLDKIPENGTKWEFEPLHWERGGWCWGGSKSVHNRTSYGLLVFDNMTEANRTQIKRALLPHAQRAYRRELSSRDGGILEHWADPELGDPEFNKKVIVPFMEKYGAYNAMIKTGMTDAEVNKVFDEAFYTMINTRFIVQELRNRYLQDQLTAE